MYLSAVIETVMNIELEVCANSVESCLAAQNGGATRVELCMGIPEGGTTPSAGMIAEALRTIHIPIHVIIRPRGGDFVYSEAEVREMLFDIRFCREMGVAGVVFGCLTPEGEYDHPTNKQLLEAAKGMQVTFHRAFDMCARPDETLQTIIEANGFTRILTSGCANTAMEGAANIAQWIRLADSRIGIMVGSGVNAENITELARQTGACQFHGSFGEWVAGDMQFKRPEVSMGGTVHIDEYKRRITNRDAVRRTIDLLREL